MMTFLPYPRFDWSMQALDYRRLGKQRVEALQLIMTLRGESSGWRNHPVTVMWQGHDNALCDYLETAIVEWVRRGYRNTMVTPPKRPRGSMAAPPWIGDAAFHSRQRAILLRKDPVYYRRHGWAELPAGEDVKHIFFPAPSTPYEVLSP